MRSRKLLSVILSISMLLGTVVTSVTVFAQSDGVFEKPLAPLQKKEFTGEKFVAKPLVILMDFKDYNHEELDTREKDFRINAFTGAETTKEFYQKLFFGKENYKTSDGKEHITVRKFFEQESGGVYDFDGTVAGWYTAKENAAFYGKGSSDQVQCRDYLVKEAIEAAAKDLDLSKFDVEDKWDLDGDNNYNEPDGIIDSIVVIHPGLGQEWDGGSLGDDAIWPFRWGYNMFGEKGTADYLSIKEKNDIISYNPKVTDKMGKTYSLEDFTVFEQDLPVDLFCHEFGHVLGLPDLYDSGSWSEIPVENWSIMGGSYTGDPRGSQPVSYGAYCRQFLQKDFLARNRTDSNWQNAVKLNFNDIPKEGLDVILDQASLKGNNNDTVRIDLPGKQAKLVAQPRLGKKFFYSGAENNIENYMTTKAPIDLTSSLNPELSINAWYNIDAGFDFASVQVKEVGTNNWVCIKDKNGFATDKVDPWLQENRDEKDRLHRNPGWGFTGVIKDNKWTDIIFDLSQYKGKKIELRFRFATDDATAKYGLFFDNVKVSDNGNVIFEDDAEGEEKFNFEGFFVSDGHGKKLENHYYLLEWRNKDNGLVDQGLGCINIGRPGLQYDAGLIVWYINEGYDGFTPDQNIKNHPGEAFAMVVDADQNPVRYKYENGKEGIDRGNYQMHDAAFSLRKSSAILIKGGKDKDPYEVIDEHVFMNPTFNDGDDYTADRGTTKAGVILKEYGLKVFVTEESKDRSTAKIHIAKKQDIASKQIQNEIKDINIEGKKIEVTTAKAFASKAHTIVTSDSSKEEMELEYKDGKYVGTTTLSGVINLEFVILEDSDGNAKAIYNSAVNGIYGVDFADISSVVEEEVDATALIEKIAAAKALKEGIVVSENGDKLSKDTKYASEASFESINGSIGQAEAMLTGKFTKEMVSDEVLALTSAMSTFQKVIRIAVGEVVEEEVDATELKELLAIVKAFKNTVVESEDGDKLSKGTKYASKTSFESINGSIGQAESMLTGKFTKEMISNEVLALTSAMSTFGKTIKTAVGQVVVDEDKDKDKDKDKEEEKIDKTILEEAIKNADSLLKNLKVSLDKKGMTNGVNFWLQNDYDKFTNALKVGKVILANEKSTQDDINKGAADIVSATKLFKNAKRASTPATTDTTNAGLYGLLLFVSMLACVTVVKKSKKSL